MAAGRTRSTRRLRSWIVEQVSSGKYPGLVWDDDPRTMFRIPWKHAGKQDFRRDEDAAIFKAWAEFKGKPTVGGQHSPASWKTRLRCALNKSPEFTEVTERAQLDISEPYKVYRLVPLSEQGLVVPEKKPAARKRKRSRRRSIRRSSSESESSDVEVKQIKREEAPSQPGAEESLLWRDVPVQMAEPAQAPAPSDALNELQVDVRFEESVDAPAGGQDSFSVAVHYLGAEVLRRKIHNDDVRITYLPPSHAPPTPAVTKDRFPRVQLPDPPAAVAAGPQRQALLTLLPFMEKGVVLTATRQGVYGRRLCQGRVFWTGPHAAAGPRKMERNAEPEMLFSKEAFRQQLDVFRSSGGAPPRCGVTLCFGEELSDAEDPAGKLIIVQVGFLWAEQQLLNARSFCDSMDFLQALASESPLGEITLNLVSVPPDAPEASACGLP
ncbi:interferon regulatory factor 9 [Pungitius pungitius]|uniref:interferon regulatory factor 9 n=1 Tax=Pungitius pungitius TaxID=134920 RepID=UPI002E110B4D